MTTDIILSGVGGQGILSIATVIAQAATSEGITLKQAEVHGMSQRGGDVESDLRLSTAEIHSDLIPLHSADLIISMEPMEALRYVKYLKKDGTIITSSCPFVNIPDYPDTAGILAELRSFAKVVEVDLDSIAKDLGNPRCKNIVLLGAASRFIPILGSVALRSAVAAIFARKGEAVVESNLTAFDEGIKQSANL